MIWNLRFRNKKPINFIDEHLYLGSVEARQLEILKTHKIGHIVRITTEVEVGYTHYPLPENIKETIYYISDSPSRLIISIIKRQINEDHNVLVHCEAGISRSASVVIGYLMMERGMSATESLGYVESKRNCVWPNAGFWKQL